MENEFDDLSPVDTLIAERSEPEVAPFPLEEQTFEVFLADYGSELPIGHRLRRPTKAELIEREQAVTFSQHEVSATETETVYDAERANRALWEKLILFVTGYDMEDGTPAEEWRPADDLIRKCIPSVHKTKVIAGMYSSEVEVDSKKSRGYKLLGAVEARLVQLLAGGTYRVVHVLRRPLESEWLAYQSKAIRALEVKGAKGKKRSLRFQTNLNASVDLYDALLERIEGATLNGETYTPEKRLAFLAAIDPLYKQHVISEFTSVYGSQLRD